MVALGAAGGKAAFGVLLFHPKMFLQHREKIPAAIMYDLQLIIHLKVTQL